MDRRRFVTMTGGMLALPAVVRAQPPSKIHHVGCLYYGHAVEAANRIRALRAGLQDHGYVEGKNLALEIR